MKLVKGGEVTNITPDSIKGVNLNGIITKVECSLCGQQFSGNHMSKQQDKHQEWHKTVGVAKNKTLGDVVWRIVDFEAMELALVK